MKYVLTCLLFLSGYIANAQTCTGGLGDPIVNISFGAGSGYGAPLAAGITNLQYTAGTCPNDGQYAIVSRTSNVSCHPNSWLNGVTDHTGNTNGYFMLINASYQPNQFYVQAVSGLCVATTFQFSVWVLNMVALTGEIQPNITFRIERPDGTLLQSHNSGDIPIANPARWTQVTFNFTTPPGVSSVVIRMINNASGGEGNDLGLDDITFRPVGPVVSAQISDISQNTMTVCESDKKNLSFSTSVDNCYVTTAYQWEQSTDKGVTWTNIPGAVNSTYVRAPTPAGNYSYRCIVAPPGNIGVPSCSVVSNPVSVIVSKTPVSTVTVVPSADTVCPGTPVSFTATPTNGGSHPSYQWMVNEDSVGTNSATYTSSTFADGDQVSCLMTGSLACSVPVVSDNTVKITISPIPGIQLTPDTIIAEGESIRLSPSITGDIATYQWNPATGLDDPHSPNPLAQPATTTTYQLDVVSQAGCPASAKETVKVFHGLQMPEAFTPNGDGKNDLFRVPPSEPVTIIRLAVYNRWGAMVFATTNSSGGWDGTSNGQSQPTGTYVWKVEYMDLVTKKPVVKSGTVILVR